MLFCTFVVILMNNQNGLFVFYLKLKINHVKRQQNSKLNSKRIAPERSAHLKSAPERFDSDKLADVKFRFLRIVLLRSRLFNSISKSPFEYAKTFSMSVFVICY